LKKQEKLSPSTLRLLRSRVMRCIKRNAVKLKEIKTKNHNGNLFHELRIVDDFVLTGF
jgi:hypothetical protein